MRYFLIVMTAAWLFRIWVERQGRVDDGVQAVKVGG